MTTDGGAFSGDRAPAAVLDPKGEVDWNEAWKRARARSLGRGGSDAWDRRAPSFGRHAGKSGYAEQMLKLIDPEPSATVLDVGCGSGTLAIPLARRVESVTALDFSRRMLDLLEARVKENGLSNVLPVLGSWEDDWAALGLGVYDFAIASRSLIVDDLRSALVKLDRAAKKKVFLTAPVGTGPIDPRVFEAVGRTYLPGPDYLFAYGMLEEMGIAASVALIPVVNEARYASLDDAVERLAWMLPEPTETEMERLRNWLERELSPVAGGLESPTPHTVSWAVLSWTKGADAPE